MMRESGWSKISDQIDDDLRKVCVGAATTMYVHLADRDDSSKDSGSPLASGHYSASMRIGINRSVADVAQEDGLYDYPSSSQHQFSAHNLHPPTIAPTPMSAVKSWLRPFKLGDAIHISNASAYALQIEKGRRGKYGSWQKPRGVFLTTLDKLFRQNGWV
jgi:hypothetical protein